MDPSAKAPPHPGQRVVLLWALWVVMTLLLLAAGVVVFGGEPPPVPSPSLAPPTAGAAAAPGAAVDAVPVDAVATRQLDSAIPTGDATVRARVEVRLRTSRDQSEPLPRGVYVGVSAFGDDALAHSNGQWLGQRQPPTTWTFAVPAGTVRLRFLCFGFAPLDVALPPAIDGIADLGSIALQAEACIQLRLLHAVEGLRRDAVATIGSHINGNALLATLPIAWRDDCGEAMLPAPTGQPLWLHVLLPAIEGLALRLPDEVTREVGGLQRGERRRLEVDLQQLPACTLQLSGIASELLPHVEIAMHESGRRPQLLAADAGGRVQLLGLPGEDVAVAFTVHGPDPMASDVDLRTRELLGWFCLTAGATYELHPVEPLLGVAMRDESGSPVSFRMGLDQPASAAAPRRLQIVGEVQLAGARELFVDTDGSRSTVPSSALVAAGAMRWIMPAATSALATLRVRPTKPLPDQHGFFVGFEALDREQITGGMPQQGEDFVCEQVPPGRYRVVLWHRGGRVADIARDLALPPGSVTELPLDLPPVRQWCGEIANWSELSEAQRPHQVFLGGGRVAVADDGSFTWQRAGLLPEDAEVTFACFQSRQRLLGRLLDVDPLGCRVRVAAPADLVPLQLRAPSLASGSAWFTISPRTGGAPLESQYGQFWLPRDVSARGYAHEELRGAPQVTAWFTLSPGTAAASIPTGVDARWLTVTVQRPVRRYVVRVRGPEGHPVATVADRPQRGEVQVLVVAGTRAIEVETDGEVQAFDPAQGDVFVR